MRNTRYFVLLAILLLGLVAGCTAPAPATTSQPASEAAPAEAAPAEAAQPAANQVVIAPGQPIRIGGSFALTGPIPDPGKDIRQAAEIAIDDLNAAGGVDGFLFELVAEDGACSGDQGTVVGNKFAADPTIVAVTGGTCSGETIGLKPILLKARIPFVSPSATNPDVVSADCDVCNRVALSDALQGEVDADFVFNTLGLKKVAVMHDNSDYGKGLAEIFQNAFTKLGGEVSSFEGVQVGDTDFRAALAKIGANQPELVFFGGYSTEAALIAQQMRETAGLENAKFMSVDGAYTQQYLQAAGAAAEGTYMSFVAGDAQAEKLAAFTEEYVAKFGVEPSQLGPFHGQSYDSVMVIADAIKRTAQVDSAGNLVIDREALIKAIRATSGLQGITGTLTCDAMGECGAGGVQIFIVENGEFKQIAGFGLE
ncbi:MAG TPA: branched-chain amino acid ABC transporter substrate-binding protein [Chloroflexi bacterium]|nr:branched-chain amino acid ABC transporter substrate-binding protein [Chloroflexota bacterium]